MEHTSHGLVDVLNEQIRCAEAMLRTLGRENQALMAGDAEELNAAGAAKATLVETLEALENERRGLTEAIAASVMDAANAQPNLESAPEWRQLLGLIGECKQQNQRNGALVKARSEQVRIALRTLRGAGPDLYSSSGRTPSTTQVRPLGTA
jgi:flagellar biosynthesis/type III secretory pathway chaperone